jgi:hypothetical protein
MVKYKKKNRVRTIEIFFYQMFIYVFNKFNYSYTYEMHGFKSARADLGRCTLLTRMFPSRRGFAARSATFFFPFSHLVK